MAYAGNAVGFGVQRALDALFPWSLLPEVPGMGAEHVGLNVAFATLASPIMEELVFRRCLINRLLPFGERAALVVSALAFGLFHGTANQLCYGVLLGLVFGSVYLRTGRVRYSLGVHIAINVLSSVVLPALLLLAANSEGVREGQILLSSVILEPGVLALLVYVALLLATALLGSVFFAYGVSEHTIKPGGIGVGEALTTWGMVIFEALAVAALL